VIEKSFRIDFVEHQLIRAFSSSLHINSSGHVEILELSCCSYSRSLSSISFESDSHLTRIGSHALAGLTFSVIVLSTTLFIASDAVSNPYQISLVDHHYCREFDRWQELRASLLISGQSAEPVRVDLSAFDEGSLLSENGRVSTQLSHRCDDPFRIVVKSISLSAGSDSYHVERNNKTLMNVTVSPGLWTPTAKAKVVARLVVGLRFRTALVCSTAL
jgi:hypothetical protein